MLPNKLLEIVKKNRQRKRKLIRMWENERNNMILGYRSIKKKTKKSRETLKLLKVLRPDLRDTCIRLYLRNCRTEHNIAFFKWRENFSHNAKDLVEKYSKKLMK